MKKALLTFSGLIILAVSCKKNDNTAAIEDNSSPETISRICASDEVLKKQIMEDPKRGERLNQIETQTQLFVDQPNTLNRATKYYVPVVVHVVLANSSQVTDAQINSQIDVLNDDFNRQNVELTNSNVYLAGYPLANVANANIEFYVSSIVRKNATGTFGTNDNIKRTANGGSSPVDPTQKLNMWVCDLSSGLLGYAQFPGGNSATDGVVVDYQAFGLRSAANYPMYSVFDLGRTATHEVGHWFNLRHIWGDMRCGNDQVSDTPPHDASNGGCPSASLRSRCTGKPLEQWMNYMDYTDDRCMYMFTSGQLTRMEASMVLANGRLDYMDTSK